MLSIEKLNVNTFYCSKAHLANSNEVTNRNVTSACSWPYAVRRTKVIFQLYFVCHDSIIGFLQRTCEYLQYKQQSSERRTNNKLTTAHSREIREANVSFLLLTRQLTIHISAAYVDNLARFSDNSYDRQFIYVFFSFASPKCSCIQFQLIRFTPPFHTLLYLNLFRKKVNLSFQLDFATHTRNSPYTNDF